jgi:7,8-dihydroneopterin aldolase/epimerase/oxygenase
LLPIDVDARAATPEQAPMDLIFIEGFVGQTVIGIHESELHRPQTVVVDLVAGLQRAGACSSDHIGDTIDYSVVRSRLLRLCVEHRVQLLEAFAETIADILLQEFAAQWVRVKVVKPKKFDDVAAVGVMIERRAGPAPALQRCAPVLHLIGAGMVPARSIPDGQASSIRRPR